MRYGNDAEFMKIDNKVVGIDLGSDFCAEHEWGIKGITFDFMVDKTKIGIDGRMITTVPKNLIYQDIKYNNLNCKLLMLSPYYYMEITEDFLSYWVYKLEENGMATAWDEKSFAILVTDEYKSELEELYNAFLKLDIAVGIAPSKLFKNGGLKFCIKSRLPKETIKSLKDADLDYIALQKAFKKTKIENILKKANKKYLALSPRWKDENKKELIFWLNPYHQNIDNFGWYTIEDLIDWTKGIGKIPKKNEG